ncbi:MAG: glycosyltransferase family 9 protein [Gammaproteobacteria bacterium]|nr:glycosyltransferase family 9 protein [Gammaproteobacteria bacterium]
MQSRHFVLNRADKIGDVVLALPMAGILKSTFPGCKVSLLGQRYTLPLARCCEYLDGAYTWDEIKEAPRAERIRHFQAFGADAIIHIYPQPAISRVARQARIPLRIGTSRRSYHWLDCNRLVRMRRRGIALHEAQLNIQLLRGLGLDRHYSLDELHEYFGLTRIDSLPPHLAAFIHPGRFNLIVHPKSAGSAREWPIEHFARLIESLPPERFNVLVTGSEKEGESVRGELPIQLSHVRDLMGRISLDELIALINAADGLLAASTGPLHIAAVLGKHALGIFVPYRAKHAGRWGPIGPRARAFQLAETCVSCPNASVCACMRRIAPAEVSAYLSGLARPPGADTPSVAAR